MMGFFPLAPFRFLLALSAQHPTRPQGLHPVRPMRITKGLTTSQ